MVGYGMAFFPPDPELPEPEEFDSSQPRWWQAPEDELPTLLPISELIAATGHVAIALVGIAVYRDGMQLRIQRRLRRNGLPLREWNDLCGTFMEHMPYGDRFEPSGRLRFGLLLDDGEKVLADALPFVSGRDPMAEPEGHSLKRQQQGGGGGGSTYSASDDLWLWPLPPAGPIVLVTQWPALGIEETRVNLDAASVREAAAHARPFWSP
ncbi:hypothetical protein GCM10027064_06570 [Microbacterium petrolearium]|uniref:hypothetical protein n=1 Tax=Microbacterium maritypicum TaxID=33918 RepID=UPI002670FDF8|nr:hypothetical protein [Microbacterium liquefaciens]WKT90525.1 hypothetical protein QYR02_06245 [Microbacterium liquefaciens]WKT90526.1 hypothetical protein QYR02_06250 [Microbacterium liquefaciens]